MPYIPMRVYLVILFCGCRRTFPYFSSPCMTVHIGDVVVCDRHKSEQVVKSVTIEKAE